MEVLEKQPLQKQHKILEPQFCHLTDEETGAERENDVAKETKLVSGKARSST